MAFENFWSKHLLKNRKRTIGNLVLIILVMIPLVVSLVFVDSMIEGITSKYIHLAGGQIQFIASADFVSEDEGMSRVVSGFGEVYSKDSTASVIIKGVENGYFSEERLNEIKVEAEDRTLISERNGVMISRSLARTLGLKVGDKFALMVPANPEESSSSSFSAVFRPVMVKLCAVYSSGYSQLDENLIFGSFDFLFSVFKPAEINVEMLTDTNDPELNERIATDLVKANNDLISFKIWNQLNSSVYENFVNSQQMILIIIIVIAFIACFYCGTIAHEMIEDNYSQICTMRLLGADERQVQKTVFFSVSRIIVTGIAIGFALGLLVSFNLSPVLARLSSSGFSGFSMYLLDFKIDVKPLKLIWMALLFFGVSCLSVFISLKNEKKTSPLELLRN